MDMKRILQAFDNASTRSVEGVNDMRRFVSVIKSLNTPISEQAVDPKQVGANIKKAGLPSLKPVNPPPMPQQDQLKAGEKLEPKPDGTTVYSSGAGSYTYDKAGKPIKYTSPSFSGITQTNDLVTGNITVRYIAGPLDVTVNFDKNGKSLDSEKVQYDLGLGVMGVEKNKGITATTWQDRGNNVIQSRDMVKDPAAYDRAMAQVNQQPKPVGESFVTENNLRNYINIIEGGFDPNNPNSQSSMPTAAPSGKIDYRKPGPKTKSSQGVDLEYGIPISKEGNFMNPRKLPNWYEHYNNEKFEIMQAYEAWLKDFKSRWPNAVEKPDGTWQAMKGGLAPMAPALGSAPKQTPENVSFKDYVKMIEESIEELDEEKRRLDPRCWKNKKIGNPKTKMKGGVRVNNCVPKE